MPLEGAPENEGAEPREYGEALENAGPNGRRRNRDTGFRQEQECDRDDSEATAPPGCTSARYSPPSFSTLVID